MEMNPLSVFGLDRELESPFLITGREIFTRSHILRLGASLRRRLEQSGVGRGAVILSAENDVGFASGLVGCWMAGASAVLVDPLARGEMARAVESSGAKAAICGSHALAKSLPKGVAPIIPSLDGEEPREPVRFGEDDPLVYLFTSGSTGAPALVPKARSHLEVEVDFLSGLLESPKRAASMVSWCHIFGFIVSFLLPLREKGACDLAAGASPRSVLQRAGDRLVDMVVAVPAIFRAMVRCIETGGVPKIPSSCCFVTSGAPMPEALLLRFEELTGCAVTDLYGSTEAGGVAYRRSGGPWKFEPHVEANIDDKGRLSVRSPSVSVSSSGRFHFTGDLARMSGDGFDLIGRADDVVKIAGRRTALREVEEAVEAYPGVERAAVLAEKVRGELRLIAFVEAPDGGADEGSVKRFVRDRLADYKVPAAVRIVDRLPLTPSGKIDRRCLAAKVDVEGKGKSGANRQGGDKP